MKIVTVIPITKGVLKETLSYFSTQTLWPGQVVFVPVRKQKIPALVVDSKEALDLKTNLKNLSYSLKKVTVVGHHIFFLPEFMAAAGEAAEYFAVSVGQVLATFTPKNLLTASAIGQLSQTTKNAVVETAKTNLRQDVFVIQEPEKERLAFYKSLIRESFARRSSVFFCAPTLADIQNTLQSLEKGIREYTIVLDGTLTTKKLLAVWQQALAETHPILIIGTPLFLSLPRQDIQTIIIDRENSTNYRQPTRGHLDVRTFAQFLARQRKIKLILGGETLRSETIYRTENSEFIPASPLKYHSFSPADQYIFDGRKEATADQPNWRVIQKKLALQLVAGLETGERFLIITNRRGLAPETICQDCGTMMICQKCAAPLVLHEVANKTKRVFMCHKCQTVEAVPSQCSHCGSWRIISLGVGIDLIAKELAALLPQTKILVMDSEKIKTFKAADRLARDFYTSPGSILLGTEMALAHLHDRVENVALVGIDGLFMIPDFSITEKIFGLLIRARGLASKRFIIQTKNPDERLFGWATKGNLLDFYREELSDRQKFSYPPFTTLIKISRGGMKDQVIADIDKCAELLTGYELALYPVSRQDTGRQYRMNILLRLASGKWVDQKLLAILKSLPPTFAVTIDPATIL